MSSTVRQSVTAILDNIVEEDQTSRAQACLDYKFPSAVKNKSNSLPKSAFSNIQLRVQEIRDQLEVLKQSSHQSGSKALQQVFPRMRPPSLTSQSECYQSQSQSQAQRKQDLSSRPGFLNNRKLGWLSALIFLSPTNSDLAHYQPISDSQSQCPP